MTLYAADLDAIRAAAERIRGKAHRTPVFTSRAVDQLVGRSLFFKAENLQRVGAFKFRGACNAIARLSDADAARGVVTHSSGNHAQAVALAASVRGIQATIVMPTSAPAVKKAAVRGYGARIVDCEPTLEARESTTEQVIEQTGATLIHAYDHPDVIAGQGTTALELLEQVPELDAVITPCGGGGLLSGCTLAIRGLGADIRVFGAEPEGADDAARSKATGQRVASHVPTTIADGLLTTLGTNTWPVVRDLVDGILTADDPTILRAMRLIYERLKLVIEPSAAVPLACLIAGRLDDRPELKRVAVVLSGGNLDLDPLFESYRS